MASDKLRVLLVGNGGREHALAWKLSQSPLVDHIFVCPGNGGTAAGLDKTSNVSGVSAEDFSALVTFAQSHSISFLVPGPEAPLVAGIVDHFSQHAPHIKVFGPSQAAALMEGSKTFSKDFMKRHSIPTAAYENFSDYDSARTYLDTISHDVVIKADGLAAGKGVIIPKSKAEAHAALREIMLDREFGAAGEKVVIEEFLEGEECSILSFSDGTSIRSLPAAQDHKRIGEGDTGPNTGGMGTYAPAWVVKPEIMAEIERDTLRPTIDGMRAEGYPFIGCLFTGYMLTPRGPRLLEYNVRFGDPETQSLLALLETDLAALMVACATGSLEKVELKVKSGAAATVVVAAGGYPGSYAKGTEMHVGPAPGKDVTFFHAGTALDKEGKLRTAGGRVIASTGVGESIADALAKAYKGVEQIRFEGMQFRRDIGYRSFR